MIKLVQKYLQRKAEKNSPTLVATREAFARLESTAFLPPLSPQPCQGRTLSRGKQRVMWGGGAAGVLLTTGKCLPRFCFVALNSPIIRGAGKENQIPKTHTTTPNHPSHPGCKKMGRVVRTKWGGPEGRAGWSFLFERRGGEGGQQMGRITLQTTRHLCCFSKPSPGSLTAACVSRSKPRAHKPTSQSIRRQPWDIPRTLTRERSSRG